MDKIYRILQLLQIIKFNEIELNNLVYGSVEIREKNDNKYIYTHYRVDEKSLTKYVGEYTEELYNSTSLNNIQAKRLKKEIKDAKKELKEYDIFSGELSDKVKTNIDFVRANLKYIIYSQAIIEGITTTQFETENIIEDAKVNDMKPSDIQKIINLKHTWEFILDGNVMSTPTNYAILCYINKLVLNGFFYDPGKLRNVPVTISGSTYVPDFPIESDIKDDISKIINSKKTIVDKSIELFLYVARKQMFIDGNKRTSLIFANHYLVSHGKGLIYIPEDRIKEFKKLLVGFYETNNNKKVKEYIKKYCYIDIKIK